MLLKTGMGLSPEMLYQSGFYRFYPGLVGKSRLDLNAFSLLVNHRYVLIYGVPDGCWLPFSLFYRKEFAARCLPKVFLSV